ncbi:hypothetical protein ACXYMO_09370 [Arenibacterium sp. CAU 1754]
MIATSKRERRFETPCYANSSSRGRAAQRRGKGPLMALSLFLFSAGIAFGSNTAQAQVALSLPENGLPAVPAERAVALFDAICGKSLPNFAKAKRIAATNGLTQSAAGGAVHSTRDNLAFRLEAGPGVGKSCVLIFETKSKERAILRALKALNSGNTLAKRNGDMHGLYQGRPAVFFETGPLRLPGVQLHILTMWSER